MRLVRFYLIVISAIVLSSAMVFAGGESEKGEKDLNVVKIGVSQPLSGPDGRYGEVLIPAFEYAVKQINDQGGIQSLGGANLEIVWSDHQSNSQTAMSEMERLIEQENVSVIVGANLSGIVLASTTVTERLQVPYVVDVPAHKDITERGFKYVFRTNVSADWYGKSFVDFADYLNAEKGADIKRVATAYRDTEFPTSVTGTLQNEASSAGYNVVWKNAYPSDVTDLTTYGTRVKNTNPDALVVADNSVSYAIMWANTLRNLRVNPKMIITCDGAYEFAEWADEVGDRVRDGWLLIVQWNSDLAHSELVSDYAKFTDQPMNGHVLLSMQAVYAVAEALELAGSSDPQALRDALSELRIESGPRLVMPWDYLDYDSKGQNTGARNVVVQWQDGELVTVYPSGVANAEPRIPYEYWKN